MSKRPSVLIVLAASVVTLVALDVRQNLVSTVPAGVPLEERKGGSWTLEVPAGVAEASAAGLENGALALIASPNPVTTLRARDCEQFRTRFDGLADSALFGTIAQNGRLIKQVVENEAAALESLYDFTSSRDGARSTWDARGYRFRYRNAGDAWSVVAEPLTQYRTGVRSFYVDETGVYRVSLTAPATSSSSVVGAHENWTCRARLVKLVVRSGTI